MTDKQHSKHRAFPPRHPIASKCIKCNFRMARCNICKHEWCVSCPNGTVNCSNCGRRP